MFRKFKDFIINEEISQSNYENIIKKDITNLFQTLFNAKLKNFYKLDWNKNGIDLCFEFIIPLKELTDELHFDLKLNIRYVEKQLMIELKEYYINRYYKERQVESNYYRWLRDIPNGNLNYPQTYKNFKKDLTNALNYFIEKKYALKELFSKSK